MTRSMEYVGGDSYVLSLGTSTGFAVSGGSIGRRLVVPALLAMSLTGTTGLAIPLAEPPSTSLVSQNWTGSGAGSRGDLGRSPGTSGAVRRLRATAGLTWDELARLFGVSRRTVHNWANGGRMTARNASLLGSLDAFVTKHDQGTPKATRAHLMAPRATGSSYYDGLALMRRRSLQPSPEGARPGAILNALHDGEDHTGSLLDFETDEGELWDA